MSVDKSKLLELNNLVSVHFRRKHKIVLNPEGKNGNEEDLNDDNLTSYIQKWDDEAYDLPDWYGREVDENRVN